MNYDIRNFQVQVIERSAAVPVLVDFWADWCGPCKMLAPVLERLAAESEGKWELAKLDTEQFPEIAARYGVRGIPNVKLFVDGAVAAEFTGALPASAVRSWLEKNLPGTHDREMRQARGLLAAGEEERARDILETIVAADPRNDEARALLSLRILRSDPARAASLVAEISEDSRHHDIAESVRLFAELLQRDLEGLEEREARPLYRSAIEALRAGDFDAALRDFIEVIRLDRHYDGDGSRRACLAIFRLLGEEHETTLRHRKDFNRSLY